MVYVGETAAFSVIASDSFLPSYQWRFNGTDLLNETDSRLILLNVQFTNARPYSVVVTDDGGAIRSRLALGPVTDRNLLLTLRAETLQIANPWMPALVTVETRRFHAGTQPALTTAFAAA